MREAGANGVVVAASRLDIFTYGENAGAPGFEPGITGPKPVALPLGYAPQQVEHLLHSVCLNEKQSLAPAGEEQDERDDRECRDADDGQRADHDQQHGHDHHERLGDRGDPRDLPRAPRPQPVA